ncbi:MAG: glycoside hydrolase family 76 protein [bacterium]|nr:glycoside hydrolase family 76 protein [bacterium]
MLIKEIFKDKKILLWTILGVFLIIGGLVFYYSFKYNNNIQSEKSQIEDDEPDLNTENLQSDSKNEIIIVPKIDKELVSQKIEQGVDFLFRAENKETNGFYKMYDAVNDDFGTQVHSVYSASIVYTLLNVYEFNKDKRIMDGVSKWADFLLFMQNNDKKDKRYGAFSYSYDLGKKEKEQKFVVGTSALNILTLLKLHELNGNSKYLESAKLAGDWLVTMQQPNGSIMSYSRYDNVKGKWVHSAKESFLYNGQVLTALSRLYKKTGDKKYYDSAEKIAIYFAEKYEKERDYIVDEYRTKNPISNSWVVMSLMEFYKNANQDQRYKSIVFELGDKILANQKTDASNLLAQGMWNDAYSSSGIGWISEVMTEMYKFCKAENKTDCDKYKDASILATRWLIQNTYSEENSSSLKNPEMALGGIFWNVSNKYVRTDSICHGLNGYLGIVNEIK